MIAAMGCGSKVRAETAGVITMTTSGESVSYFALWGSGTATIDWGDGSNVETGELSNDERTEFGREFSDTNPKTITITGANITGLYCMRNELTALDVSRNPALTWLLCGQNQLTALDVSKNPALEYLSCDNNQLTELDVSRNPALTRLKCYNNQFTAEVTGFKGLRPSNFSLNAKFNDKTLKDAIITFIKAVQNKDENAINQFIHPNFGIILLARPGAYETVELMDKISFSDNPPSGYWRMPLNPPAIENYSIRYQELPVFDCDEWKWNKPAGIYGQAVRHRTSPADVAWRLIESDLPVSINFIKKLEKLEIENNNSQHYSVMAIGEIDDSSNVLDFTFTLINGKWYLTVINMASACA